MNLENMSYKKLKELDFEEIKDEIKIDWDNHCYNPKEHNCDGRCQGAATKCPLNPWNDTPRVAKEELINYFKKNKFYKIYFNKFIKSEKGQQMINELKKELKISNKRG